jgi:hypothetical protein
MGGDVEQQRRERQADDEAVQRIGDGGVEQTEASGDRPGQDQREDRKRRA